MMITDEPFLAPPGPFEVSTMTGIKAIVLARLSTSGAATAVRSAVKAPVLTSPETAVLKLNAAIVPPEPGRSP